MGSVRDVLIVGAGPAGAVAACVLARQGARVLVVDRARFPRDKLCGDTVNPGTLALLRRLGMADTLEARGLPIDGMVVTGEDGVAIEGRYPGGLQGRALVRRDLDAALLESAMDAGAQFEPATTVRSAIVDARGAITGVVVDAHGASRTIGARVVIAADGRHSALAFGLGLAHHPRRPRRWAIGAYFEDVARVSSFGEMHVRSGVYVGIAPARGGLANVCLVKPWAGTGTSFGDPATLLKTALAGDPILRERFADARMVTPPIVLGPLAVDVTPNTFDGLLLAGDAAGFIDPMTGDGMRFAVRGGELAAEYAGRALAHGWAGIHQQLTRQRRHEFSGKWRFNRTLRALVASPSLVRAGAVVASVAPSALRAVVRRAGDCALALT
jgi:geranylgeranyl reductase family protein